MFIQEPPSELEPKILSRLLNQLCDIGLEITGSTLVSRDYNRWTHNYQVIPSIAFPGCCDVIDGL